MIKHLGERTHACTHRGLLNLGKLDYHAVHECTRAKPTSEGERGRTGALIFDDLSTFYLIGAWFPQLLIDLSALKSSLLKLPGETLTTTG